MRKSKDVMVYQREKGRKLFLVACQLKHEMGSIPEIASILEKANYNLVSGFISNPDSDGYGTCSFFLEAVEGRPSTADLKSVVQRVSSVKEVEVKEALNGLLVDTLNFPLSWNSGDRVVTLRTEFFATMLAGLKEHFKSGADVVLHEMGFHHGRPTWENVLRTYPVRDRASVAEALGFYDASGWGKTQLISFDIASKKAVVRVGDNFECALKERSSQNGSNFFRGHMEGLFTVVFGAEARAAEKRCLCMGDPYCEFDIRT